MGALVRRVAGSQNANAFKSLSDFLGSAIAMNEAPLALEILKKIGETGQDSGCSTRERKEAILAALCAFEWNAGMSVCSDTYDTIERQEMLVCPC